MEAKVHIDKDLVAASATPLVLAILAEGESYAAVRGGLASILGMVNGGARDVGVKQVRAQPAQARRRRLGQILELAGEDTVVALVIRQGRPRPIGASSGANSSIARGTPLAVGLGLPAGRLEGLKACAPMTEPRTRRSR